MGSTRHRLRINVLSVLCAIAVLVTACASETPADRSAAPGRTNAPGVSAAPGVVELVDVPLEGTLPRSVVFAGARITVAEARVTNLDLLRLTGTPEPGPQLFAVLEVTGESATGKAVKYHFDDKAFQLRTWSGQLIPAIDPIGGYRFGTVRADGHGSDRILFPIRDATILDGAALVIGTPPDAVAVLALTAPPGIPDYPVQIVAMGTAEAQIGEIAWGIASASGDLDRPLPLCCPDTGDRADANELYLTVMLVATTRGSRYGRASASTRVVRLVADGAVVEFKPVQSETRLDEGASVEFEMYALIPREPRELYLEFTDPSGSSGRINLAIGGP